MQKIIRQLAAEIKVGEHQVKAAVDLLDGGATVPFIARYRKEATNGLDDIQLREVEARLAYLRELEDRRAAVLKSIEEQGKLTPPLRAAIDAAPTKQELEDLYLPYKPKRRTKGQMAREAGIEPLADRLFADPSLVPADEAVPFVKPAADGLDFSTVPLVLDGVRDILSERWAEDAALVQQLREWLWAEGLFRSKLMAGKDENNPDVAKFRDYFDYDEPIGRVPSHRALAVFRGRAQDILDAKLVLPVEPEPGKPSLAEGRIALHLGWSHAGRPADDLIRKSVAWTWRVKLSLSTERDLFTRLREDAEKVAIKVFADNLRDLLLAAPAGPRVVMGLDPGIRTGVKVAVVDATGKLVETATVFPHEPRRDWEGSLHTLGKLCAKHGVNLIAIGNGTASRGNRQACGRTDQGGCPIGHGDRESGRQRSRRLGVLGQRVRFAGNAGCGREPARCRQHRAAPAGSAGRTREDRPQVDRCRPVPARRQPERTRADLASGDRGLCELGGCRPQHGQRALAVARVGPLGQRGQGGGAVARCQWRLRHAPTTARGERLWREDFRAKRGLPAHSRRQQSAGRDRCPSRDLPGGGADDREDRQADRRTDGSRRHAQDPQARTFREREVWRHHRQGHPGRAREARPRPAPDFKVARFNDGVEDIKDLVEGMVLEGTVSNVAQFGAFIDVGVHQDGLVHVSQLAHKFVSDAREVVKTGDIVKVKVMEVDVARKRIGLSMKLDAAPARRDGPRDNRFEGAGRGQQGPRRDSSPQPAGQMASAFAKLQGLRK